MPAQRQVAARRPPLIMINRSELFTVPLTLAAFIFINRYCVQSVVSSGVKG